MAIEGKMSFLAMCEKKLSSEVTAADMEKIMSTIADVAEAYEMKELEADEYQNSDMLNGFLAALRVEGRSEKTIAYYQYVIGRTLQAINIPMRRITVYHIRNYFSAEKQRGLADTSLESKRQVLSSYFGWLTRESLIEKNPITNIGTIKCAKKKKPIYSDVEKDRLNQACRTKRERAILAFLSATGCRISEVTELDRDMVNLDRQECIVHGKGNKERIVFIDDVATMLVKEYLAERKDEDPALFVGQRGRLTPCGIRAMLNKMAERAGVEHVHPHKFRRTLATNLTRKGMPIQSVAELLGHEKLDTTMKYVSLCSDDIKNEYRKIV